jgi:hypothetical protein
MQWRDDTTLPTAALRDFSPLDVRYGSWLCENSSARRARSNISKKLRTMESNRAPRTMFDIISDRRRRSHTTVHVRFAPKADKIAGASVGLLCADCVAKVQNCAVINFPPQDKPTDDQRSV